MSSNKDRNLLQPASPTTTNHNSKLPKFLQKSGRDRSKSVADPGGNTNNVASSSFASASTPVLTATPKKSVSRTNSKQASSSEVTKQEDAVEDDDVATETPVIVEPAALPRPRTRSERPLSDTPFYQSSLNPRLSDLPTRLSGWFSHTFSVSSTDLSLPSILSQVHSSGAASPVSPKGKGPTALLTVAKHGKGHLDKAMRYLLDSDATPDNSPEPIWLLGISHTGFEAPPSSGPAAISIPPTTQPGSSDLRQPQPPPSSYRLHPENYGLSSSQSSLSSSTSSKNLGPSWPPVFFDDFTSRIWLTYRSHFSPIRDTNLACLSTDPLDGVMSGSPQSKKWFGLAEKGWTSDAGWGCMLRTGQSLLANALLHLHLGRDWRRPPYPLHTADFAMYVRILTWFFDSPSLLCPFSVHRMALAGKDLGKDVGQWFGPSTAAGAIRTLVHAYPEAGLGVSVAADSVIYQTDVFAASNIAVGSPRRHHKMSWGPRGVLVLIGIRLGQEGVNPIYYDTIKELFTFPQSVGIAGGRPSSSYYFVGSQADNLFYLDPHHARPAIPLRTQSVAGDCKEDESSAESSISGIRRRLSNHSRSPTSPRMSNRRSTIPVSSSSSVSSHSRWQTDMDERELGLPGLREDLDPMQQHFVSAYSAIELKTFHCDRVRKMPLSGLDPSMLIGFFCRDEADWIDLKRRIETLGKTHKSIFSIQDEPPAWLSSDNDSSLGLESISDPDLDIDEPEDDDDEFSFDGDGDAERNEDSSRSGSNSPDTSIQGGSGGGSRRGKSSEIDTEEDPIGPITPHAGTFAERGVNLEIEGDRKNGIGFEDEDELPDDDEWVDPVSPPLPLVPPKPAHRSPKAPRKTKNNEKIGTVSKKKRSKTAKEVPIIDTKITVSQHFPFPSSTNDELSQLDLNNGIDGEKRVPQMRTTKARDGGRTQSGGVRGILVAEDGDDF